MRPMSLTTRRRKCVAGVMALATAGGALAENKKSTVKIAFTPNFLKDDFQTLMLKLSKKAFAEKGFTVVGAPDPNGDIAAQVDDLENLLSSGANVLVFAPIDSAGIVPAASEPTTRMR